ncbi:MAG: DUF1622 domain-containing protein [Armatimonadota bacterium]
MREKELWGEGVLAWVVSYVGLIAEAVAVVLITFAVGQAVWSIGRSALTRGDDEHPWVDVRLHLARWLAMALEFLLAADIIRTALAPTWDDIGKLGAIAVIRTGLNFFLRREMQDERQEASEAGGGQHRAEGSSGRRAA